MHQHPLKIISLLALVGLILSQLSLLFVVSGKMGWIAAGVLTAPLLIPLSGIAKDRRYTYKWVGFLTLFYVAIGVSELFTAPDSRLYATATLLCSCTLFITSIYYSRFLRSR